MVFTYCLSEDSVLGHLIHHEDLGEDLSADASQKLLGSSFGTLFTTVTSTFSYVPIALEFFSLHNPEVRWELHSELVIEDVAKEIFGLPRSFGSSSCNWVFFLRPLLMQPDKQILYSHLFYLVVSLLRVQRLTVVSSAPFFCI